MSLKKSDKIIAIVGVLILIVAAVGIYFYVDTEEEIDGNGTKPGMIYKVEWIPYSSSELVIDGYAGGKTDYTDPIVIMEDEGSIITKVNIRIEWQDDKILKLAIFRKGEDTLKANIGLTGKDPLEHTSKGLGNETLAFSVNDPPLRLVETYEEVEDIFEIEDAILKENEGKNAATFDVTVQVTKGEKLLSIRPIRWLNFLLDKGDDFQLYVDYEYYEYTIEEIEDGDNNNDDNIPTGNEATSRLGKMVQMGQGRW